ncbi:MAG: beta-lactamase family protein [Anaerolineae bacterium]|nr:beta-lactamase family protein [Anaerolineae bacterium]
MVIDIEVDEIDGTQRVGAVWQKNTDGRGWYEYRNLTSDEFHTKWDELRLKGYRVVDQDAYVLDGKLLWAGVWIENKENLGWASRRNLTSAQFGEEFDDYKNRGFIMVDVEAYRSGNDTLYGAVWVENAEKLGWAEWRNLTSAEFGEKFAQYKDTMRMLDVESYRIGNTQYYAGIWIENKNGRGWYEYRDMTAKQYGDKWLQLRDAGYRVIDYEVYETGNGWRYAGIWRQNSERPNWVLKNEVDALAEDEFNDEDIPGMSIAIARNGTFLYLRGFGEADMDDNIIAHSRTVYRLASISKAVCGTLGFRLQQLGQVNLSANVNSLVAGMPAAYTFNLSQTLSNRSGIGHYPEYSGVEDDYTTALAAAQEIWGQTNSLPFGPPGSTYKYSTHAYTFFGAGVEGATGQSIFNIVPNSLTNPFDLNSLRIENRDLTNPYRASLYDSDNDEVGADNLEWKVCGGGLESSAYDLARFGIKTMNGAILNAASRAAMWTPPDGLSNYAYGWNTGTEQGTQVVAKDGAQLGSRTYMRMYPALGITIVVLTNRKGGGHDPNQLAKDIGALMLDEYLPLASLMTAQSDQSSESMLADEDLDEPPAEATDRESILIPVVTPKDTPSAAEKQEVDGYFHRAVFVPLTMK